VHIGESKSDEAGSCKKKVLQPNTFCYLKMIPFYQH